MPEAIDKSFTATIFIANSFTVELHSTDTIFPSSSY